MIAFVRMASTWIWKYKSLLGLFSLNKLYWTSNGRELEPENYSLDTRAWQYRAQKLSVALPALALLTWTGITSWRTSRWKRIGTGFSTAWRKHKFQMSTVVFRHWQVGIPGCPKVYCSRGRRSQRKSGTPWSKKCSTSRRMTPHFYPSLSSSR